MQVADIQASPESLKYVYAAIRTASESYVGYAAVLCIIIAVCFYFISIRKDGFSAYNLAAYLFTLLFLGALSYAAFSSLKSVKQLIYAGYDNGPFNVGYFSKISDAVWEDVSLRTVYPTGQDSSPTHRTQYDYCYLRDSSSSQQDRMILVRLPPQAPCPTSADATQPALKDAVRIEIDMTQRRISFIEEDGSRSFLYEIIAAL